jgi:aspartyl/asparaginyl-tRNA synthetase
MGTLIDPTDFTLVIDKLREFFRMKGFLEVHTQNRLSILAACEDPETISTFSYANSIWPLPQTGQMWLEYEMLTNPDKAPGYFCVSTSYRNEPTPVEGRHDLIFPMFEFELKGGMDELLQLEREMLVHLGMTNFVNSKIENEVDYCDVSNEYNVDELEHEHEEKLCEKLGPVVFLKNFPVHTSPFWNMKLHDDKTRANKVDVLLCGMETIGSAERSCDVEQMRKQFYEISDGGYSKILFDKFGKEVVEKELNKFFEHHFFPRSGGGIGITRLIRAMKILKDDLL